VGRHRSYDTPEFKAKISRSRREHTQRHPYPPQGDKMCATCRDVKHYDIEQKFLSDFTIINRRRADGSIVKRPYYECKTCRAERMREKRNAMDPEERRAKARAYWAKYISNPENREKMRAYSREYDTIQRRKNGVPYKGPWKKYRDQEDDRVPREPFANWVIEHCPLTRSELAEALGIPDRSLRRIIDGREKTKGKWYEVKTVSVDLVDRALIATGNTWHLRDLYPDLYS